MRLPSSTLLLVLASVVGSANASDKSFLRQARQDETTVGANPKYTITHESVKAEEASYWYRLMQETTMSVAPTPGPPSPTPEPPTPRPPTNPAPTAPVTPAPIPEAGTPSPVAAGDTIEAIIQTIPELSTLVSVLDATGLLPELGGPGPLTLFAPTNTAFEALNLPPDTPADVITNVLLYHVVSGQIDLAVGSIPYTALNGDELVVTVSESERTVNTANIGETYPASNGVVYIIDAVLIPPIEPSTPPVSEPTSAPLSPAPTPEAGTPSPVAAGDTIEAIIQTIPELSTLVSVLDATGLLPELGGPGPLTLFAPTNTAFEALNLPPDTPVDVITNVLLYHVVGGQIDLAVGSIPYTALNGDELVVTVSESERTVNTANIGETYPASNGVVYIIDAVLIPPIEPSTPPVSEPTSAPLSPAPTPEAGTPSPVAAGDTIEAIIQTIPELSTLVSVLDATGLLPELGGPGPLTLFAPTNAAFGALNLPPDTSVDVVTNVLLYHVVSGQIDLAVGSIPYTALNGDELVVTVSESERTVNTANIADTYPASNGVVYIVDAVLIPPTDPSPTPASIGI